MRSRFAPSTTGRAHPGTLLAALLCWLDGRTRGAEVVLRLEDLDPQRCDPATTAALADDLAWFGLDWDLVERQTAHGGRHVAALRRLAEADRLYPCACSRAQLRGRTGGRTGYDGHCRGRTLRGDWLQAGEALRLRIDAAPSVRDETGADLGGVAGDPVVRRRDGAVAYHLASVVDDAACGVERVVRGRDLADSTGVQVAIQHALGLPVPRYRHHLLLLEANGDKLAKFHGAIGGARLRAAYDPAALCGLLAQLAGLRAEPAPCTPAALLADFAWDRVRTRDQILEWTGERLVWRRA